MAGLKLRKLRDRRPIALTINVMPDLHARLQEYTAVYAATYGSEEPVSELIPAMLDGYLESDRQFQRARNERQQA